jgi:hypothetical protein
MSAQRLTTLSWRIETAGSSKGPASSPRGRCSSLDFGSSGSAILPVGARVCKPNLHIDTGANADVGSCAGADVDADGDGDADADSDFGPDPIVSELETVYEPLESFMKYSLHFAGENLLDMDIFSCALFCSSQSRRFPLPHLDL